MRSWFRDVVHNCFIHPWLPFLPVAWGDALHDRNAKWAFREDYAAAGGHGQTEK